MTLLSSPKSVEENQENPSKKSVVGILVLLSKDFLETILGKYVTKMLLLNINIRFNFLLRSLFVRKNRSKLIQNNKR